MFNVFILCNLFDDKAFSNNKIKTIINHGTLQTKRDVRSKLKTTYRVNNTFGWGCYFILWLKLNHKYPRKVAYILSYIGKGMQIKI